MRRKDREMDRTFGLEVIDRAPYGVLSLPESDSNAYGVPLSLAREGEVLYFHAAKGGKKASLLCDGTQVHIVFVGETRIPTVLTQEEAAQAARNPKTFGLLTSKLFTTEYESAMVRGTVRQLREDAEKIHALRVICQRYTPQWMQFFPQAVESGLSATAVYAVAITDITAKRKRFDALGQEMKWQRTTPQEASEADEAD